MESTSWEEACLQVLEIVARVTTGVGHEIKNKLAVLVEQGALMRELAQAAAKKGSLDPARVESLAQRLVGKIWETDEIVRRMNGFAHGGDRATGCLEAGEALGLMIALHRRMAEMKPVAIAARPGARSINLETRPIFLLAALFACLEAVTAGAPPGAEISAAVVETGAEVRFDLSWEGPGDPPLPPYQALFRTLGARVERIKEGPGLSLTVSGQFRCGQPWTPDKV